MENKKKLIRSLARAGTFVLGIGLAGLGLAGLITNGRHEAALEQQRSDRAKLTEKARSYLSDLAPRINRLPVDPTLVNQVQASYFQDRAEGRRFVWAMDASGGFLFGVPREDFARLNAAFDAQESEIRAAGFTDRQDLLRRLIQAADELRLPGPGGEPADAPPETWAHWRRWFDGQDWFVLSAPLQDADGHALGNLYMKVESPEEPWPDDVAVATLAVPGALSGLSLLFLWFLLPTWVYVDARERGVAQARLWSFLALVSLFVGLVVYLIARPEQPNALRCPGCGREVNGGTFCPYCGQDLGSAFCGACRYPLKPDWSYCPSCRAATPRSASDSLAAPAGS